MNRVSQEICLSKGNSKGLEGGIQLESERNVKEGSEAGESEERRVLEDRAEGDREPPM